MPALGMAQETGKLVRWLKHEGDQISKGEPLMEVETDKATVEVEAPASGTLAAITAEPGDDISVGHTIALILAPGESMPLRQEKTESPGPTAPREVAAPARRQTSPTARPSASPKARRLAQERGVDIAAITGTGPGGAVIEEDILGLSPSPSVGDRPAEGTLWRAMAENVTRSWQEAPHFFVFREVDASGLVEERGRRPDTVTYTDLVLRAVAVALVNHPRMNGHAKEVNIGLAVAVPEGLIVPVIHGVDRLSVEEIATRRQEVVERVKAGRVRSSDVSDGTFTVSNLGMYAVDLFTAILTEGQAGILAVGRIADRVMAHQGAAVVRPTMLLSLSSDHRRVDGARAAEFVQALTALLEMPAQTL